MRGLSDNDPNWALRAQVRMSQVSARYIQHQQKPYLLRSIAIFMPDSTKLMRYKCSKPVRPRPHQAFRQHKQRRQNNQCMFDPTISLGAPYIMRENQARSFQLPFAPLRPRKARTSARIAPAKLEASFPRHSRSTPSP